MLGNGINDCVDGSDEAEKSQGGAIAGAVVGSLFFVVAATLVAWWSCRNCACGSGCGKGAETAATKENADPAHMAVENQAYEFTDSDVATAATAAAAVDTTGGTAAPMVGNAVANVVGAWDGNESPAAPAPAPAPAAPAPTSAPAAVPTTSPAATALPPVPPVPLLVVDTTVVANAVVAAASPALAEPAAAAPAPVPSLPVVANVAVATAPAALPPVPPLPVVANAAVATTSPAAEAAPEDENPFADSAAAETAEEEQFTALFASGNPDATKCLSAKSAGALLTKSGLKATALRSVWTDAKKEGPGTCPTNKMDIAEFLIAASLAVKAGGKFEVDVNTADVEC